ncbi:MAG: agmatinase [Methanotrichaceae archaeon]|nr:agmatinase [Methanotrichaceae archaeon]
MFQRATFADASSELMDAEFVIMGMPFDSTTSFRPGSRAGPEAVRQASWNFETYIHRHGVNLNDLLVCDLGDLDMGSTPDRAWEAIRAGIGLLPSRALPVTIGGEHSITPPIVGELLRRGKLSVLVLDAHLDLREEYGGTAKSHACASRRILDHPIEGYASIGIRSGSEEEYAYARDMGIEFHESDEVAERGMAAVLDDALDGLSERIYLSIDFDAIDPAYAPAVGNPEPFGLHPRDVRLVIDRLADRIAGLDVNEIAPVYDSGQTATLGAKLIREFMAARAGGRG